MSTTTRTYRIGQAHVFRPQTRRGVAWAECFRCGVTQSREDYATKRGAFA